MSITTPVLVRISDKLICYYKTHLHYYSIEIRTGTAVITCTIPSRYYYYRRRRPPIYASETQLEYCASSAHE